MSAVPNQIEVDFRYSDLPLEQLIQHVWKLNRDRRHVAVKIAFWIALTAAVVAAVLLIKARRSTGPELVAIDFAVGMLATLLALWFQTTPTSRKMISAMQNSPSRSSGTRTVLDEKGITVLGAGSRISHSWRSIVEVVVAHETTLIMASRCEFFPIPHHALPTEVTPALLAASIDAWRGAAERNPWPDPPPFSSTVLVSLSSPRVRPPIP